MNETVILAIYQSYINRPIRKKAYKFDTQGDVNQFNNKARTIDVWKQLCRHGFILWKFKKRLSSVEYSFDYFT